MHNNIRVFIVAGILAAQTNDDRTVVAMYSKSTLDCCIRSSHRKMLCRTFILLLCLLLCVSISVTRLSVYLREIVNWSAGAIGHVASALTHALVNGYCVGTRTPTADPPSVTTEPAVIVPDCTGLYRTNRTQTISV